MRALIYLVPFLLLSEVEPTAIDYNFQKEVYNFQKEVVLIEIPVVGDKAKSEIVRSLYMLNKKIGETRYVRVAAPDYDIFALIETHYGVESSGNSHLAEVLAELILDSNREALPDLTSIYPGQNLALPVLPKFPSPEATAEYTQVYDIYSGRVGLVLTQEALDGISPTNSEEPGQLEGISLEKGRLWGLVVSVQEREQFLAALSADVLGELDNGGMYIGPTHDVIELRPLKAATRLQ